MITRVYGNIKPGEICKLFSDDNNDKLLVRYKSKDKTHIWFTDVVSGKECGFLQTAICLSPFNFQ